MSTTVSKIIEQRLVVNGALEQAIPLSANKVLKGTFGILGFDGYAYPFGSTTNCKQVIYFTEEVDNSAGSAGDKKVKAYLTGPVKAKFTSITQASVGQVAFIVDNETLDDTLQTNSQAAGQIIEYVSATEGWINLGSYGAFGGKVVVKKALTAAADNTAGAVLALLNPLGIECMVESIVLKITTAPTDTAAGVDVGIANDGTTSNDTLIDGKVLAAAGYFSNQNSAGTNGGMHRKLGATQYITASSVVGSHYDLAAMVGQAIITLQVI